MIFDTAAVLIAVLIPVSLLIFVASKIRFKRDVFSLEALREGMRDSWRRFPMTVLYSLSAAFLSAAAIVGYTEND